MKIATWNINSVRRRSALLEHWLQATQPDIVCLQELKATEAEFPFDACERAGYGAAVVGQKTWNGVAVLTRDAEPRVVRRTLPGDAKDKQARYLEVAHAGVLVASLYLPNGNPQPGPKFDYKLAWFERLLRHAQSLLQTGEPIVLAGDYNVVPTDRDIYDTRSWLDDALLQPESRDAYARLLAQGWTDALRHKHPKDFGLYTFWDYKRNRWPRDAGLRIDHMLVSAPLRPKLRAASVHKPMRGVEGASDHAPVWLEIAV
ncbi:MAG: exodeoxyribonuclease III [Burkholderiales bacterium]|jgi:exodeoxyribonuclease-3|nr:exodeoxyribonuclease III [Burkholderiales bacterium]